MAAMRDTLLQAREDAIELGYKSVCQFKTGFKAMNTKSNVGKVVWTAKEENKEIDMAATTSKKSGVKMTTPKNEKVNKEDKMAKSDKKTPKVAKVKEVVYEGTCHCGCGESVRKGSRFLPGHDQRLKGQCTKIIYWTKGTKDVPRKPTEAQVNKAIKTMESEGWGHKIDTKKAKYASDVRSGKIVPQDAKTETKPSKKVLAEKTEDDFDEDEVVVRVTKAAAKMRDSKKSGAIKSFDDDDSFDDDEDDIETID